MPTPWIVANWKMNKGIAEARSFVDELLRRGWGEREELEVGIAPPFTALHATAAACRGSRLLIGAQDIHWEREGAYTGEVSAQMVRDAGAAFVLVGHSERRRLFGETDDAVCRKAHSALELGLRVICCVGETLEERKAQRQVEVVEEQLRGGLRGLSAGAVRALTVAYEPVWAIGTGVHASPGEVDAMHRVIRSWLLRAWGEKAGAVRVLYGGSVNPENAPSLMEQSEVSGLLVGGASLETNSFVAILEGSMQHKRESRGMR